MYSWLGAYIRNVFDPFTDLDPAFEPLEPLLKMGPPFSERIQSRLECECTGRGRCGSARMRMNVDEDNTMNEFE